MRNGRTKAHCHAKKTVVNGLDTTFVRGRSLEGPAELQQLLLTRDERVTPSSVIMVETVGPTIQGVILRRVTGEIRDRRCQEMGEAEIRQKERTRPFAGSGRKA